jgi:adenylate cyclase
MDRPDLRSRLLAILAADAAGYSRLMSLDDVATVAALDGARAVFREHIAVHGGVVIDTAGDSVLAVFDTAAGAVKAALAAQKQLADSAADVSEDRRMHFRIGVHMGDVIEKADGTVYGDGVNIAVRLQTLAEPGGITVSESIRNAVKGKVGASFEDRGEQQVKNITDPVRAYRVGPEGSAATKPVSVTGEIDLSLPDKPSIAVLPFTNLSGDPEQEFFSDGVTEDIVTELSRLPSLFVIARNSSFTYKGRNVDVRAVARELGVRYVLEGSIRRAGQRVRVAAQLVDALVGTNLWAQRYDRALQDIFAVQEELTRQIVMAIAPEIEASELARIQRSRPESLSAYELGLRAYSVAMTAYVQSDEQSKLQAQQWAEKALAIDARCVSALNAVALISYHDIVYRHSADPLASYRSCVQASDRALAADSKAHHALMWRGLLEVMSAPAELKAGGLARLRRAHEINPNDAGILGALGHGETVYGNPVRGMELSLEALRMSPRDPGRHLYSASVSLAYLVAKDYALSLEWAMRAMSEATNFVPPHEYAAMAYVGLGRIDEAQRQFAWLRRVAPAQCEMLLKHGQVQFADPEHRQRTTLYYRIAAGVEPPRETARL